MLQLRSHGVSTYEIVRVLACSRNTVYRYLRQGGWQSSKPRRTRLSGHESWLAERFERHGGNADVIRQELRTERSIEVSLRTVERAVQPLRHRRRARQLATRRFETPLGDQLQVDFGQMPVPRDRHGTFEPQLVERYCRRLPGFDAKVTQWFAHGMTTRRIRATVKELYGVEVSTELISKMTDAVHEEFEEWPLRERYAIVYLDAIHVKVRLAASFASFFCRLTNGLTSCGVSNFAGCPSRRISRPQ